MAKYILLYTGGKAGSTEEETQAILQAWGVWYTKLGEHLVDGGSPVMPHATATKVTPTEIFPGVTDTKVTGYSVIQTDTKEEAINFAKECPILDDENASVEVHELWEMSQNQ
ncbi:MAG: hypothetical protein OHK0017_01280 [Patescibacteria group bacterium]